mmetsp:Transcript_118108/g.376570  ORF Transcript_118108/g.376570 Transcript_118108/m.376570 type:complete len:429 (+) Transcript_118108:81-1367(+)
MVPVVDRQPGCVRGRWVPKHLNVGEEGSCGLGGAKVCVKNTSITVVEKKVGAVVPLRRNTGVVSQAAAVKEAQQKENVQIQKIAVCSNKVQKNQQKDLAKQAEHQTRRSLDWDPHRNRADFEAQQRLKKEARIAASATNKDRDRDSTKKFGKGKRVTTKTNTEKDEDRANTQNKFGNNVMTSITKEKAQNHEPRKQMGPIVRHGARQVVSAPVRAKTLRKRYLLTAVASFLVFGVGAGGAEKDLTNKLCAVACNFTGAWYEARTPSDDPVAAEDLLRRGADRDARVCDWSGRENWTFLSCAAYLNNFGVAKTIVAHRPSIVNSTNEEGTTPLMFAVEYHFDEFGKMLVEHGAPINAKKSKDGDTAIRMAIKADLAKTVEMSLDHGLSVNARRRIAPEALRAVFQQWDNAQILNSHTSLSDREMRDFCI